MEQAGAVRRRIVGIAPSREIPMIRRCCTATLIAVSLASATTRAQDGPGVPFVLPATTLTVSASPDVLARGQAPAEAGPGVDGWFQTGINSTQVLGGAYASGAPGPRSRQFN